MMKILILIYRFFKRKISINNSKIRRWKLKISQGITIPTSTYIGPGCQITGAGKEIRIGENTTLVSFVKLDGPIQIGNNVIIAPNCTLIARNHDFSKSDALPYGTGYEFKPIIISDNVWIGSNVSIIPGVHIDEGAIIGMGSVVTNDVLKCSCVGGNPAEIIGMRDEEHYHRLVDEHKYLNNIRGSYINRQDLIRKNKDYFKQTIQEKGYMVSYELNNVNQDLQSYVLYHLHIQQKDTLFGNAGKFHIALQVDAKEKILAIAEEISLIVGNESGQEDIFSDLLGIIANSNRNYDLTK